MDKPSGPPSVDQLRRALEEQAHLLTGPDVKDVVRVRVERALDSTRDLVRDADTEAARELAGRTIAWLAESVGEFQRLPEPFARGRALDGTNAPLLLVVDQLDLLGLTLDHAYDAAHRGDAQALQRQLDVLVDRFPARTSPAALMEDSAITDEHLDQQVVRDNGLEVGEDGIPRIPVPDQPDPVHETDPTSEEQR